MVRHKAVAIGTALGALLLCAQPAPSILTYVKQTWNTLTRSNKDLAKAAVDPKFHAEADGRWPIYISRSEDAQLIEESLRREMPAAGLKTVEIRQLPEDMDALHTQGLLYLPKPYVVPGGRFNEMYGWDSYFIQVGLLQDGENEMAKNMADNFLYEVKNYGKVLNANRTYYLNREVLPALGDRAAPDAREWVVEVLGFRRRPGPGGSFGGARCRGPDPLRFSEAVLPHSSDQRLRSEPIL
jgi:hypothetical protein